MNIKLLSNSYYLKHLGCLLFTSVLLLMPVKSFAGAIYDLGEMKFSTSNQSLWGAGQGIVPSTINYNYDFSNTLSLGTGIAGSRNEVIVPAWTETIPAVKGTVWVPGYYDLGNCDLSGCPWVRGHNQSVTITDSYTLGHDAITADTRIGTEVTVGTAGGFGITSDLGLNGGTVDADVSYDVSLEVPDVIDVIDVGEFFSLNPNSSVSTEVTTTAPNLTGTISTDLDFSLNYNATECIIVGNCSSSSGTIFDTGANENVILQVNTDDLPPDRASIFELDHQLGDIALFDATQATIKADLFLVPEPIITVSGIPLLDSRPPLGVGVNILELALNAPGRSDFTGNDSGAVSGNTQAEIIRMSLDLDTLNGVPGGVVLKNGGLEFRGDLVDVDLAPTVDYRQNIEFTPTLMVTLEFSDPVYIQEMQQTGERLSGCSNGNIIQNGSCGILIVTNKIVMDCNNFGGICIPKIVSTRTFIPNASANIYKPIYSPVNVSVTSLTAPWNDLPPIALINDKEVTISPKFWLQNEFSNKTWFDFDLNVALGLLKGSLKFSFIPLWNDCLDCKDFFVANLQNFDLFNEKYSLGGFNEIHSNPFTLGTSNQAMSFRSPSSPNQVPEPATWLLLLFGFFVLIMRTNLKHP